MTERSRRYHHLQNQTRRQPTAPLQQASNMYRSDNRPTTYSINSYSTPNNYRHSSSITNTTDPSSSATSSQLPSDGCATSIFYSYLIAIFSSFLVVLGIYLSLTKFNYSFLSISLAGLLIEAFSACIYCISNIRSSRLVRRKQRITSDDFILQSDGNIIENHNLDSNFNRQQQQITTITHILSNRNLNSCISNNNDDNNNDIYNPLENSPSAINNADASSSQTDPQMRSAIDIDNERATNQIADSTTIQRLTQNEDQVDSNNCGSIDSNGPPYNQLPKSTNQIESPETISGDFTSSTTNLLEHRSSSRDIYNVAGDEKLVPSQLSINIVSQFNSQLSDNDNSAKKLANAGDTAEIREESNSSTGDQSNYESSNTVQELPHSSTSATSGPPESTYSGNVINHNDNSDLTNKEEHQAEEPERQETAPTTSVNNDQVEAQVRRKKILQSSSQRPSNLRRTLVMGLSGEQEMIEIDEEDLDNMSILPPSYESIATNTRPDS